MWRLIEFQISYNIFLTYYCTIKTTFLDPNQITTLKKSAKQGSQRIGHYGFSLGQ